MKKLFIINGTALSGKDTFVNTLIEHFLEYNIENHDSVGLHKHALNILGWDGIKDEKSRELLSFLKEKSDEYYDTSFNYIKDAMEFSAENSILFYHVREPEKIKRLLEYFDNSEAIFIKRTGQEEFNNNSDKVAKESMDLYKHILYNDSTLEDFNKMIIDFGNNYIV